MTSQSLITEEQQIFQSFPNAELAHEVADRLKQNNIDATIENTKNYLDTNIAGTSLIPTVHIKLKPADFERANQVLDDYYQSQLNNIESDYYLLSFSNDELREIISKPDEWGHLDYQLAQKLLSERGQGVDIEEVNKLKQDRIKALSQPEKASRSTIFFGYCFIPFGIIVGFLIGRHLLYDKKLLPNGQTVYTYREADRKQGYRIMVYSGVTAFMILVFYFISLVLDK